jgi:hypothetical protein
LYELRQKKKSMCGADLSDLSEVEAEEDFRSRPRNRQGETARPRVKGNKDRTSSISPI